MQRFGSFTVPMYESLAKVDLDVCGRPYLHFETPLSYGKVGDFDIELAEEFFHGFVNHSGTTLHINVPYGTNQHHIIEAIFKAVAKALYIATRLDEISPVYCPLREFIVMSNGSVIAVILGGGRGTRLFPLTRDRAKPSVPIAGKFRLVDIPISNCLHSGLEKIYVLTQFNSVSLNRHIAQTYRFDTYRRGFVQILAAQQTLMGEEWYQGTADAIKHNEPYI